MRIRNGMICVYHSFDIGSEILVEKLEKILGAVPKVSPIEVKKISPRYVQYRQPPLLVSLGTHRTPVGKRVFEAKVLAKIYDFGVITILYRMPFSGDLKELRELSARLWDALPEMEKTAFGHLERIRKEISPLIVNPVRETSSEDYVVYYANSFDRPVTAGELARKYSEDIACIVASEPGGLSAQEIKETFKNSLSYSNDLVVAGWNSAFVYDTEECYDTLDVLEYANIELLELRLYDNFLDNGLDRAYDDLKKPEPLIGSKYARVSKELSELRLEVSEVVEKVENSLKLVGEQYLARVHEAISSAFHLKKWKESVNHKLDLVQDIYTVLNDQIQMTRLIILEVLVVALIAAEIVIALL